MICHWDEVETGRAEAGHIAGEWTDLGTSAGTKTVGLCRIRISTKSRSGKKGRSEKKSPIGRQGRTVS